MEAVYEDGGGMTMSSTLKIAVGKYEFTLDTKTGFVRLNNAGYYETIRDPAIIELFQYSAKMRRRLKGLGIEV